MINIANFIDHTNLRPEAIPADIERLCSQARDYNFKTVCLNPAYIELAVDCLKGSRVAVGTVCGFPLGATRTEVKVYEAEVAENAGAQEIDLVANLGAIKSADWHFLKHDISRVRKALAGNTILKVILECALLDDSEMATAAAIAADSGADFVKTSTGFVGGATLHQVGLLFNTVGRKLGIKASGGIRDLKTALAMIEAGASRLGTSAGAQIMEEFLQRHNYERP